MRHLFAFNTSSFAQKAITAIICFFIAAPGFAQHKWQAGDLIFRTGTQTVSDLVMIADSSGYSHVGMIVGTDDAWYVIHATPEEVQGRGDAVALDSFEFFTSPQLATQYRIYHVAASDEQHQQAAHWAMAQEGQPFRILDEKGLYCTTLILKAWQHAGVDLQVQFSRIDIPMFPQTPILFPSDLMASPLIFPATNLTPVQ